MVKKLPEKPDWAGRTEQFNPYKYFGGACWWDNYYEHSPEDSDKWLKLMEWANEIDSDLKAMIMRIRNTGAKLIKSDKYGYAIQPVIGKHGWNSKEEYERECHPLLKKFREQLIELLRNLK
jgi:hypothetical protein